MCNLFVAYTSEAAFKQSLNLNTVQASWYWFQKLDMGMYTGMVLILINVQPHHVNMDKQRLLEAWKGRIITIGVIYKSCSMCIHKVEKLEITTYF